MQGVALGTSRKQQDSCPETLPVASAAQSCDVKMLDMRPAAAGNPLAFDADNFGLRPM